MIRAAALVLVLAAPAAAQVRVSPAASAWAGPVTAVFAAAGQERVAALGMVSLTRLASPGADGRLPVVAAPQTLNYLAQALEAAAVDIEVFAKRPTQERLAVLRVAAEIAEERARLEADAFTAAAAQGIDRRNAAEIAARAAASSEYAPYLDEARANALSRTVAASKAFGEARSRAVAEFLRDLPAKFAAGAFDASNSVVKSADGWEAPYHSPNLIDGKLFEFYRGRLYALQGAAKGPWTADEALTLRASLDRPDIAAQLAAEGLLPDAFKKDLEEVARLSGAANDGRPRLKAAAADFARVAERGGVVPARSVKAVLSHYNASVDATGLDFSLRARVLAAIRTGRDALPAWEELMTAKERTSRALHRRALRALVAYIAGMAALIAGVADLFTGGAKFLVLAAALAPIVYMVLQLWRRDTLEWSDSWGLREYLRRAFPNG